MSGKHKYTYLATDYIANLEREFLLRKNKATQVTFKVLYLINFVSYV